MIVGLKFCFDCFGFFFFRFGFGFVFDFGFGFVGDFEVIDVGFDMCGECVFDVVDFG